MKTDKVIESIEQLDVAIALLQQMRKALIATLPIPPQANDMAVGMTVYAMIEQHIGGSNEQVQIAPQ